MDADYTVFSTIDGSNVKFVVMPHVCLEALIENGIVKEIDGRHYFDDGAEIITEKNLLVD